jgi:MFS family permease
VLFTLASILCGRSEGLGEFVVVRILQGVGGAMMVPVGRLVVLNGTPKDRSNNGRLLGECGIIHAAGIGPDIGDSRQNVFNPFLFGARHQKTCT